MRAQKVPSHTKSSIQFQSVRNAGMSENAMCHFLFARTIGTISSFWSSGILYCRNSIASEMGGCGDLPRAVDWSKRGNPVVEELGLHRGAEIKVLQHSKD
jgi:hypothetical protein